MKGLPLASVQEPPVALIAVAGGNTPAPFTTSCFPEMPVTLEAVRLARDMRGFRTDLRNIPTKTTTVRQEAKASDMHVLV
jgi:hypothetical protein